MIYKQLRAEILDRNFEKYNTGNDILANIIVIDEAEI